MRHVGAPSLRRTRRNHAVEHATIHLLSADRPGLALAGRSDSGGFYLYGDVPTAELRTAVDEAIGRLAGEPELAVHAHCGTNLVVAAVVSAAAALAALWTLRADERATKPWSVLPRLMLAETLSAIVSRPLGPLVQRRLATHPEVAGVAVARILEVRSGRFRLHRVELAHAADGSVPRPGQAAGRQDPAAGGPSQVACRPEGPA